MPFEGASRSAEVGDRTWITRSVLAWALVGLLGGSVIGTLVARVFAYQSTPVVGELGDISGPIDYLPVTAGMAQGAVFGAAFGLIFALPAILALIHSRGLVRVPWAATVALILAVLAATAIPAAVVLRDNLSHPHRDAAVAAVQKWSAARYQVQLTDDQASSLLDYVNTESRPGSLPLGDDLSAVSDPDSRSVGLSGGSSTAS